MSNRYPQEAIDRCLALYLQFNGGRHEQIEKEMRRKYPRWRVSNLYDTRDRLGWITRFNFESELARKRQTLVDVAMTSAETLYFDVRQMREKLRRKIDEGTASREEMFLHRDYCKMEGDLLAKLPSAHSRYQDFATFLETLVDWLPQIDRSLWSAFNANSAAILEKAKKEYAQAT